MSGAVKMDRERKAVIVEDATKWELKNLKDVDDEATKIDQITLYLMAKYLFSRRIAKEYAQIVVARKHFQLPQQSKTEGEILREKGGYWKVEGGGSN